MVMNMFGLATYLGLNSALETLVSQAYGANKIKLCGYYLQRGRILVFIFFFPMLIGFISSKRILLWLG